MVFKDGGLCKGFAFGGPEIQREMLEAEGGVRRHARGHGRCQWDGHADGTAEGERPPRRRKTSIGRGTGRMTMKQGYVQVHGRRQGQDRPPSGWRWRPQVCACTSPVHEVRPYWRARCVSPVRRPHRGGAVRHGRRVERPPTRRTTQAARRGLAAAREAAPVARPTPWCSTRRTLPTAGVLEPTRSSTWLERPETVSWWSRGAAASGTLMAVADLVTEMRGQHHYGRASSPAAASSSSGGGRVMSDYVRD
ncbi:MAG: hypothetical protein ACLT98_15060 [Eggerthellaceae bacterium]